MYLYHEINVSRGNKYPNDESSNHEKFGILNKSLGKIVHHKSCAEGEREFGECSIAFTGDRSRDTWPIGRKENKECSLGKVA